MSDEAHAPADAPKHLNVGQAAFIGLDLGWKRSRTGKSKPVQAVH